MTPCVSLDARQRFEQYLARIGTFLWDCRQRASFATYTLGLLSELPRKSVEPIAALFTPDPAATDAAHQRLLHFLCDAPWPDHDLRRLAARYALEPMTQHGPVHALILDDTAFPKSGPHSVGVQPQYCGALGKVANCQVAVSLTLATPHSHLPVDMRLYLPKSWLEDPERCRRARIPDSATFQTKPQLGLQMIREALRDGLPAGVVLADAAFGDSSDFRRGVRELDLDYIVGIHLSTLVQLVHNEEESLPVQALLDRLSARTFRRYTWREGSRKRLSARFAFVPVRTAKDEPEQTLWLILERRDGAVRQDRAYLSSLPPWTPKKQLVYLLKERWRTEAAYREMKNELGLDHYEGRRYTGFTHHVTAVLCTYAFVVAERDRAFPPRAARRRRPGAQPPPEAAAHGALAADGATARGRGDGAVAGAL
ncbi:MAG: IS701 family transposase [Polyangia bacterium]